jgi:hypothetical protein
MTSEPASLPQSSRVDHMAGRTQPCRSAHGRPSGAHVLRKAAVGEQCVPIGTARAREPHYRHQLALVELTARFTSTSRLALSPSVVAHAKPL